MPKLFIGALSWDTSDESLREAFEKYGQIVSATVICDRTCLLTKGDTGKSKGFGFVEYNDLSECKEALDAMNGQELDGRSIRVDHANDKPRRGGDFDRGSRRDDRRGGDRGYERRDRDRDDRRGGYGDRDRNGGSRGGSSCLTQADITTAHPAKTAHIVKTVTARHEETTTNLLIRADSLLFSSAVSFNILITRYSLSIALPN